MPHLGWTPAAAFLLTPSLSLLPPPKLSHCYTPLSRYERRASIVKCLSTTFAEAVRRGYVRNFGRTLRIKADLSVVESESLRFPDHIRPHLLSIKTAILQYLGASNVYTVYVRGSVTTKHFFEDGRSDLDLVVVTKAHISLSTQTVLKNCIKSIATQWKPYLPIDLRCIESSSISPNMAILLHYYSLPLYTSVKSNLDINPKALNVLSSAINIRDDERKCMALFQPSRTDYAHLKLPVLQWLCKRCLRTFTELLVPKTRKHARDLVPCFELCSSAYPEHTDLVLTALQVACAHKSNGFVGLGHDEVVRVGIETARNLVEVVEDVFLKQTYGSNASSHMPIELQDSIVRPPAFQDHMLQAVEQTISGLLFKSRYSPAIHTSPFARCSLPKIDIEQLGQVTEKDIQRKTSGSDMNPSDLLVASDEPFIVRGIMNVKESSQSLLTSFVRNHRKVSCRISPTNIVTFCRSEHPWIKNELFTPSSVLHSISTIEAIQRLKADCGSSPLMYSDSIHEHLYIQTDALISEQLFDLGRHRNLQVVQRERIWISTHGTVSSLHYDASHSALLQLCGRKRMLFFSPECLDRLGIYPLGHPLHRRARVRLDHSQSRVFRRFWTECSSLAKEAVLGPGDLIVFPPNWSHYTESIASNGEVSMSRTLRYMGRTSLPRRC